MGLEPTSFCWETTLFEVGLFDKLVRLGMTPKACAQLSLNIFWLLRSLVRLKSIHEQASAISKRLLRNVSTNFCFHLT